MSQALAAAPQPEPLSDGIYFDLPAETYHQDAALGSTDMKKLSYSPEDYWFASVHNPLREPDEPTPSKIFGTAVHTFVLDGRAGFELRYGPTKHPGNIKAGMLERQALAEQGKIPLKERDYARIMQSGTMIAANPHLSGMFSDGHAEVSVFWTEDGVRRKARLDYLKPDLVVDLKSIRNSRSISFVAACQKALADFNYPVQAAHYSDARQAARRMIREGKVYGPQPDPAFLDAIRDREDWAFVFVFWQAEGAPLTWPCRFSQGSEVLATARRFIETAVWNYRIYSARFGFETPWVQAHSIEEVDLNDIPFYWGRS